MCDLMTIDIRGTSRRLTVLNREERSTSNHRSLYEKSKGKKPVFRSTTDKNKIKRRSVYRVLSSHISFFLYTNFFFFPLLKCILDIRILFFTLDQ